LRPRPPGTPVALPGSNEAITVLREPKGKNPMTAPARRILVVDDEENVCKALRRTLKREGYDVTTDGSPPEALEILKTQRFDLVMSDHLMPNMTGLEFLKLVHDRYPDSVRIMLTGHADIETAIAAINQGEIYRFLTKPWDDAELKVTLFLAFERLDLERQNRQLLATVRRQHDLIQSLEAQYPGISRVERDADGAILIDAVAA
jgi:DNA-binding NtrC family response regulator